MNGKILSGFWQLSFSPLFLSADAQQAGKVYRVGRLSGGLSSSTFSPRRNSTRVRELGYVEGKNIAFEFATRKKTRAAPRFG